MPTASLIADAIEAAFKLPKNSMGSCITKVSMKPGPGGIVTMIPVAGTTQVDPKLAKAIAGAVADGIAKFLP